MPEVGDDGGDLIGVNVRGLVVGGEGVFAGVDEGVFAALTRASVLAFLEHGATGSEMVRFMGGIRNITERMECT